MEHKVTKMTRGIRNNNPGNIKKSKDKWRGLSLEQKDPIFFVFGAPIWGIRALAKVLLNYEKKYGLKNVKDIINRWAPDSENPTNAYVTFVAKELGVEPERNFDVWSRLEELVIAIIKFENGYNPYTKDQIQAGIDLADMP